MATYTDFVDGTYNGIGPVVLNGSMQIRRTRIDFSLKNAARSDVLQAMAIPAKSWVMNAWLEVEKTATANALVDLGYGSLVDAWGMALPIDSAGVVDQMVLDAGSTTRQRLWGNRSFGAYSPRYFESSDTIDLISRTVTISRGVLRVYAMFFMG